MNKLLPLLLCLTVALLLAHGMPPISREFNARCRCSQVESRMIPPHRLRSLKIFPQDAHCHQTEVIVGLTNGERVCLNPQSAWVRKLVQFALQQQQQTAQPQTQQQTQQQTQPQTQ